MERAEKCLGAVARFLSWIAGAALFVLMALTVYDVVKRIWWDATPGLIELVSLLFVFVVYFGLAIAAVKGDHVSVDLLVGRLKPRVQAIIASFIGLLSFGVWAIIAWQSAAVAVEQFKLGEYSPALNIKLSPFRVVLVIGVVVLCLALLLQLVTHWRKAARG